MVRLKVEAEAIIRKDYHLFQFHNGSIKRCQILYDSTEINGVSIPQWFD